MRGILLLALLAGIAFADVARGGGDSFENAVEVGQETFPVGGEPGSKHYFFTNLEAGNALIIERYCENQSTGLDIYDENKELLVSGSNRSVWSASSDSRTYLLYFVVTLCTGRDWITVNIENRQDIGSGTDAGRDFAGALAASGGASHNCCHLSINNSMEGGNDNEDAYMLVTNPGTMVTVDTLAPLELIAYTYEGTEITRAEGKLSFMPQAQDAYFLVRTTPAFLAGTTSTYSLLIEGAGPAAGPETGATPQQQQQAPGGEKNGTRRDAKRPNITSGPAEERVADESPANKSALEAISDQISGTIKLAWQEYGRANISMQKTDGQQGGVSTTKKATAILIAAGAIALIALIIRARRSR